jgi:hypothetical protein
VHTRFSGDRVEAYSEFDRMKIGQESILALCPQDEADAEAWRQAIDAVSRFVVEFP